MNIHPECFIFPVILNQSLSQSTLDRCWHGQKGKECLLWGTEYALSNPLLVGTCNAVWYLLRVQTRRGLCALPLVTPPNGCSRSSTITHYASQTVYRLTLDINSVNTGYGGCGEATHMHTHKSTHILTHTSISVRKTKRGSDCKNRPWAVFSQTGSADQCKRH